MENIIKNLTKIASSLDNKKQIKIASQVDKFADRLMQIKTAQYVGIQGYWIRNERCWTNCYRQKRAKTPDKASQVVWQECQNEYVESINNPTSGWEKYANDTSLKKFASKHQQELIEEERKFFNDSVRTKIANGMDSVIAIYDTVEQRKGAYINEQVELANSMLKFAEKLDKDGFKEEAQKIALEAKEIVKECAGFFSNLLGGLKGEGQVYQQAQAIFTNNITALINTLEQFQQKPEIAFPQRNKFTKQMQTTIRNLQGFVNKAKGISSITSRGVWELTTDFMNRATPVTTAISNAADVTAFSQAVNSGISVLNTFVQEVPKKIEQQVELLEGQEQEGQQGQEQEQEQFTPVETLRAAITNNGDILSTLLNLPENLKARAVQMLSNKSTAIPVARAAESYFRLIKKSQETVPVMTEDQIFNELIAKIPPQIAQQFISQVQGQQETQEVDTETVTGIWRIMKDYVENQPDKKRAISNLKGKLTLIIKDIEKSNRDQSAKEWSSGISSGWQMS